MTTSNKNANSSSSDLGKLRVDFYESGNGETIIITFPNGGLGIVDAHPSSQTNRPNIAALVAGKKIHFVCLSHPHADHGIDLIPVLETHPNIEEFWHSTSDVVGFIFCITETNNYNYPSAVAQFAHEFRKGWAEFLVRLYGAVAERNIEDRQLHSNVKAILIDGVEIHVLSPEESIKNKFNKAFRDRAAHKIKNLPDPNLLSTVLALKYGQSVVLLGSDALKENWASTTVRYRQNSLPKALVLKVPHHGSSNAIILHPKASESNYLNLVSRTPRAKAVLFAGDAKHPGAGVYQKLRANTDVMCLSNGLVGKTAVPNPLGIGIPGARAVTAARICNPLISFELDENGNVNTLAGVNCDACPA